MKYLLFLLLVSNFCFADSLFDKIKTQVSECKCVNDQLNSNCIYSVQCPFSDEVKISTTKLDQIKNQLSRLQSKSQLNPSIKVK